MDAAKYQKIAEALLQKCFLIELNDTELCETDRVESLLTDFPDAQPFEFLNELMLDMDMNRYDIPSSWDLGSQVLLTIEDQNKISEGL